MQKLKIMKVMYATARQKMLLIARIILLGCIALGYCYYTCRGKEDMEKSLVVFIRKKDQQVCVGDSNEDNESDVME